MGEAPLFGRWKAKEDVFPYTPFFTPPYNEAKVLDIGQPVGHIESETLGLRGYSIESVNNVPELIETSYCPLHWAEIQPDVPASSVRTGFSFGGRAAPDLAVRGRRQLQIHANTHIKNSHPAWRPLLGHPGFETESAELRKTLEDRPEFTTEIELDGHLREVVTIEHMGYRFAELVLPEEGFVLTIAGHPDILEKRFALRLPKVA